MVPVKEQRYNFINVLHDPFYQGVRLGERVELLMFERGSNPKLGNTRYAEFHKELSWLPPFYAMKVLIT